MTPALVWRARSLEPSAGRCRGQLAVVRVRDGVFARWLRAVARAGGAGAEIWRALREFTQRASGAGIAVEHTMLGDGEPTTLQKFAAEISALAVNVGEGALLGPTARYGCSGSAWQ